MIRGSCLCRVIQFEADTVSQIVHCHCSMCRKAHGAAFASFAIVPANEFRFVKGQDLIQLYESSPGSHRAFCRVCGSNAPGQSPDGKTVFIPAGLFDDDPTVRPALHMFVGSKAPWWDVTDTLPKFDEWPDNQG